MQDSNIFWNFEKQRMVGDVFSPRSKLDGVADH
jgi:hypothetical protein